MYNLKFGDAQRPRCCRARDRPLICMATPLTSIGAYMQAPKPRTPIQTSPPDLRSSYRKTRVTTLSLPGNTVKTSPGKKVTKDFPYTDSVNGETDRKRTAYDYAVCRCRETVTSRATSTQTDIWVRRFQIVKVPFQVKYFSTHYRFALNCPTIFGTAVARVEVGFLAKHSS